MTDFVAAALANGTWKEKTDNGKTYYYCKETKETCWDLAKKFNEDPVAAAISSGVWKEKKDPTGKTYYYNTQTKATTWNLAKELGVGAATTTAAPAAGGDDPVAAALASGTWKEKKDPSGKTYYYNPTTKATTWNLAKELGVGTPSSAGDAADPVAAALASGTWKEKKDPTGKTYYYNPTTKATTWNLAKELGVGTPSSVADTGDPVADALASGLWKEKKDPTGKTYYYNTKTKATCWNLAKELGVSAATTPRPDEEPSPSTAAEEPAAAAAAAEPVEEKKEEEPAEAKLRLASDKEKMRHLQRMMDDPKWLPPPPPLYPPAPPTARHPDRLAMTFDTRSQDNKSDDGSIDPSKEGGWRNYSKTRWLEEIETKLGEKKMSDEEAAAAALAAAADEKQALRFAGSRGTITAQETLKQLSRKSTDPKHAANSFVDFRDGASQTVFGPPTADVAIATLNAASNIAELVPIPDAGILACSTLESLRKEQDKAQTLLQHVQGCLAAQMQEAGVAFSGHGATRQLKLNISKPKAGQKDERTEIQSLAKELAPAYQSLQAPPAGPYWRFVTEHESNALYDDTSMKRARVASQLSDKTLQRHDLFDRIHGDLRDQYVLREKMWTEYGRIGAQSFVDVADFVLKTEGDLRSQRQKELETAQAAQAKSQKANLDDDMDF